MSVLSDFILLGHDRVGSFSLGTTKMDLFTMSVDSIAKTIADTINTHAIPRLIRLNGMDTARIPKVTYSEVAHVDLGEIATFVTQLAQAGVLAPDPGLEDHIRELAGLPPANHGVEDTGTGQMSPEDAKAVLALPAQQRIIAERTGVIPDPPAFPGGAAPFAAAGDQAKPKPDTEDAPDDESPDEEEAKAPARKTTKAPVKKTGR